jgi:hypothetical protein
MSSPGTIAILVPVEEEFAPHRELLPGLRRAATMIASVARGL